MAVTVTKYNVLTAILGRQDILDVTSTSGVYVALMNSSHVMTSANSIFATISANTVAGVGSGYFEHTAGGGTPTGGALLSSTTLAESDGVATFDAGDIQWSASGATIPATGTASFGVMLSYSNSAAGQLMFNIAFGQEEQAGDGTDFKITWNGSGIYTLDSNP